MTLILSALTKEFALQVCDRRLTNAVSRKIADEEATKAVLWNNHLVFGYTGLAELMRSRKVAEARGGGLGRRPTNMWLAEVLSLASSPDDAAGLLSREAARGLAPFGLRPERRGLAFIGVGWTNRVDDPKVRPTLIEVSNIRTGQFEWGIRQLNDTSEVLVHASHPNLNRLVKEIRSEIDGGTHPAAVAELLTDAIKSVATKDRSVGPDVLQTCLPRELVETTVETGDCYVASGPPALDHVSFRYVGAGGEEMIRSPTVVLGGLVAGQMKLGEGREGALHVRAEPPRTDADDPGLDDS